MSSTVYNATTGRYVTTLNTSAGAKKQASTAAIKSKEGGQATPLTPTASSVKVSLSSTAKAVLTGSTKLKLSELVKKLDDPKFSSADVTGVTLYLDSNLKELTSLPSSTYSKLLNLLGERKLIDVRANNDAPVKLDADTYATIQSNDDARALLDVTSNLSLDLPTGSDGKLGSGLPAATLARFKTFIESNKATKVTIDGRESPVTLTPDVVASVGAKSLARYAGKISIDATSATLLTTDNWESLRLLNNYRELSINLNQGVPSTKTALASLSTSMSKLNYQQFIGGFNLIGSISPQAAAVAMEPADYNATAKTQQVLFSGLFINGDTLQVGIAPPGKPKETVNIGPLVLPNGASPDQQGEALLAAVKVALAKNSDFAGLSVTRSGNALNFSWSAAPTEVPPVAFIRATHVQEGTPDFGVELTDVPPSAVQSLTNYPQVYGLNVKGTADQLISNSDKLNKLISNGFIKTVQLIDAKTSQPVTAPGGQLPITAAQAARSIPLLEKVGAGLITISDNRTSPAAYANFTDAAANNLRGGIQISGSASEILNSLKGLVALTRMGKITSLTMTGANGRQTVINNFDINKLSDLVVSLRKGA